jgi:hypothetical protein
MGRSLERGFGKPSVLGTDTHDVPTEADTCRSHCLLGKPESP